MSSSNLDRQQAKADVVEAALLVLDRYPYRQARLDLIASQAGYSTRFVKDIFGTKAAVIEEAVRQVIPRFNDALAVSADLSLLENIAIIKRRYKRVSGGLGVFELVTLCTAKADQHPGLKKHGLRALLISLHWPAIDRLWDYWYEQRAAFRVLPDELESRSALAMRIDLSLFGPSITHSIWNRTGLLPSGEDLGLDDFYSARRELRYFVRNWLTPEAYTDAELAAALELS